MTRRVPWHPVLFAATIVVTLWLDAAVSPYAALRSLVVAVALAVALTLIAGAISRSIRVGAIVATAIIGVVWSKQLIVAVGDLAGRMGMLAVVWGVLVVVAAILGIRLWHRSGMAVDRVGLTAFLNRASLMLIVAALAVGIVGGRTGSFLADLDQGVGLTSWPASRQAAGDAPDIYVILLDGYPRADVLEYAFDVDNSPFVDGLAQRGFRVATASHSDYLWTHLSVPSALNLAYVEQIPAMEAVAEGRAPRQPTLRRTIASNVAFDVAREHGYVTVGIGSGFEQVAPRLADVYVDGGELNEFEVSLLTSTFAADLINVVAPDVASGQQGARIRGNLAVLPAIASIRDRGPVLVFAHVPAPHQPTVFSSDGRTLRVPMSPTFYADSPDERGEDPAEFRSRYRDQVSYLNSLVLAAVDGIIDKADQPPVIVLFSDHGSASAVDWNAVEAADADPARLLERTGTLFAALTPGRTDLFPDDISPVDLFRLLFDGYLGTQYGRATPPAGGGQVPPIDASVLSE